MRRTGSPPELLEIVAEEHANRFARLTPIAPHHRVLDLGCGIGRDAILLMPLLEGGGTYDGVDLDLDSILWCSRTIGGRRPGFRFHHANLRSTQYNPHGRVDPAKYRFPVEDGRIDRAFAHSLFTHLLPDAAKRYLEETRRVLAPDGLAMYTFFTGTPEEIDSSRQSPVPAFQMGHRYADGCYVLSPQNPEASVAYTVDRLLALVRAAGLELAQPILEGSWVPGRTASHMQAQDILILRIPRRP